VPIHSPPPREAAQVRSVGGISRVKLTCVAAQKRPALAPPLSASARLIVTAPSHPARAFSTAGARPNNADHQPVRLAHFDNKNQTQSGSLEALDRVRTVDAATSPRRAPASGCCARAVGPASRVAARDISGRCWLRRGCAPRTPASPMSVGGLPTPPHGGVGRIRFADVGRRRSFSR
jgi:hypothetical protein